MTNDVIGRYLREEISAGKACELMGVTRHVGEEILTAIWKKNEALKMAKYLIMNCGVFQWSGELERPRWNYGEIGAAVVLETDCPNDKPEPNMT